MRHAASIAVTGLMAFGFAPSHVSAGDVPDAVWPAVGEGHSMSIAAPVPFELVWVPPGRYRMGDTGGLGQADERPLREVRVEGFWLMRSEVTRAMFAAFVEDTGHAVGDRCWVFEDGWKEKAGLDWRDPGFVQADDHPVSCVNWHDAQAFADWLSAETGTRFRLPTEAQWEYAVRAGTETTYFWGEDPAALCAYANAADQRALAHYPAFDVNACDDGHVRTSAVARYRPNPWGLYDLYGNVWEWVEDCWNISYAGAPADGSAWLNGDCTRRVFRGGGYGDIPRFARSTLRNRSDSRDRKDDIGFRLVAERPAPSATPR